MLRLQPKKNGRHKSINRIFVFVIKLKVQRTNYQSVSMHDKHLIYDKKFKLFET